MKTGKEKWNVSLKIAVYIALYVTVLLLLLMLITTTSSDVHESIVDDKYETTFKF